jgi:PmbA protein
MHSHLHGHPALIQAAEALSRLPAQKFEIHFQRKASTSIEARDQKIDGLARSEDAGLSIRILRDRRIGFSYTTSLERDAVERAIQSAWEIAGFMPEDQHHDLPSFGETPYPSLDRLDPAGLALPTEHKLARALELEAACLAADARIRGVRKATFTETRYEVSLIDSSCEQLWHEGSMYSAGISCRAEQDGDNQMGGASAHATHFDELNIGEVARKAAVDAAEKLHAGAAPTRTCPAVIRRDAMADLISFLSDSFSAEQVEKGRSMLVGRLGERLFSDKVTMIDDGLLARGAASSPFDGEGTPCRRTTLVSSGTISSLLYDGYHARKHGRQSTGNAGRSIKAPPSIGATNLYLEPGTQSFEQLIATASDGVVITDLMGVHTANPVTGDFSLGASGFLIENGRIGRAIRGFAVAGNLRSLFGSIAELGSDLEFFGSLGAPSALVPELSVGGS